jgi:phosphatidylglycerophosphate synthase
MAGKEVKLQSTPTKRNTTSQMVIILANEAAGGTDFIPELARVGTLPVLLRAILGAQSAYTGRILVVVDALRARTIQRELIKTGRLPVSVDWIVVEEGRQSLADVMRVAAEGVDQLVLMRGDRTYNPSLHRMTQEWVGEEGALALEDGSGPVGIIALSSELALRLANNHPWQFTGIEDIYRWIALRKTLRSHSGPALVSVASDKWQPISTPQDCKVADRKLEAWLMKPTDGIFARTNRRISIPISRWLIKYPITPNMVTYFTLVVSIASGVFYGLGGYWNMLVGAILSLAASILDGCDGEVARIKLQSSDFGCWLDSVCDYLYYGFMFAGMAVGFARHTGDRSYLMWGGALLFGAVFTVILAMIGRRRLAGDRPEQYLKKWQENAERRASSNPIMYIGRYTEFMVRRCFLPYPFLVFAIFNITQVGFFLAAIGANIAWMVSLYSNRLFLTKRPTVAQRPADKDRVGNTVTMQVQEQ